MAIPESQLDTWSSQGSVTQSKNTYATVRNALLDSKAVYADVSFDVFLQGSYGNDTNIYSESDVDVVIRLDSIMRSDLASLPQEQQTAYHQAYGKATYTFSEFKQGVATRLSNAFGTEQVTPGDKAFNIHAGGARRSADVVVCHQYRRYTRFINSTDYQFTPGIIIPGTSKGDIINYPKLHSENCTKKHQATNQWFKPMVRIVKNMRRRLLADGVIAEDVACNYFIEGLLYNVPDDKFGSTYGNTFVNAFTWIVGSDRAKFTCVNGQYWLLGSANIQWDPFKCSTFLDALVKMWNEW